MEIGARVVGVAAVAAGLACLLECFARFALARVEEEFFLVDPDTRDLDADPDPGIFETWEPPAR